MTTAGRVQRWIDKGCDLADNGDHKGAVRLFGRAVAAGEKWVGLNLGNSYGALGDHERAAEAYRIAWREGGEDDAGYNLTNVLDEVGQGDEMERVRSELRAVGYPVIVIEDAIDAANSGRSEDAIRMLRDLLASTMRDDIAGYAMGVLGHVLFDVGDPEAETWLRWGQGHYATARSDLGSLFLRQGHTAEATAVWREGVANDEVESSVPLANWLWDEGRRDEAMNVLTPFRNVDAHVRENLEIMEREL